ncbi:hypothetical protein [Streptomyces sp. NRRL S-813]|uniref:hypothetical protein n=1 Tax=Streptomyces sp. NRRL S-813 TaxID=1463919 RepID=UPI00131DB050|nr:hypothetical protein [Streptomyces sp. NRRL S-813]
MTAVTGKRLSLLQPPGSTSNPVLWAAWPLHPLGREGRSGIYGGAGHGPDPSGADRAPLHAGKSQVCAEGSTPGLVDGLGDTAGGGAELLPLDRVQVRFREHE